MSRSARYGIAGLMRFVNAQGLPLEEVRAIYARAKQNSNPCGLFVETGSVSNTLNNAGLESAYIHATAQHDDPGYVLYQADLRDRERASEFDRRYASNRRGGGRR